MNAIAAPTSLLCELTFRCNLQCPYCYNPLDLGVVRDELSLSSWTEVVRQAAALGVLQIGFSGGEPTLRADDLVALVREARAHDCYTNLITQGTFLDETLLDALCANGLDHIQISLQALTPQLAAHIAGTDVLEDKLDAIRRVQSRPVALTLNYVLHRQNMQSIREVIAFAERQHIRKLELANVQFYGWGLLNRGSLMPTMNQVEEASQIVGAESQRLRGKMEIAYVLADYFGSRPKACMNGWARAFMTVTPYGQSLPCPAASAIQSLHFPTVGDSTLAQAWYESAAFAAYRGTAWMPEPCRSCERREIDWGGCRCQAFALTGDAAVTDPACELSDSHYLVEALRSETSNDVFVPRRMHAGNRD